MKLTNRFAVLAAFLLLACQQEVYARSNFLSWFGFEDEENHDERRLSQEHHVNQRYEEMKEESLLRRREHREEIHEEATEESEESAATEQPFIPHDRIKEKRYHRKRENHQESVAAKQAEAEAEEEVEVADRTEEGSGNEIMVLEQADTTSEATIQPFVPHDRIKERRYHRKRDNHKENKAEEEAEELPELAVGTEAPAAPAANAGQSQNQHDRIKEKRYERKREKHILNKIVRQDDRSDQPESGPPPLLELAINTDNPDESPAASHVTHDRIKENRYERKREKHLEKQNGVQRTYRLAGGNSGGQTIQHDRIKENRYERKREKHLAKQDAEVQAPLGRGRFKKSNDPGLEVTLRGAGSETISDIAAIDLTFDDTGDDKVSVVQLYWGVFNNPGACQGQTCKFDDALNPDTKASILHGSAGLPNENGDVILVSSIYRTAENLDLSGSALIDGLSVESSGAVSSSGFYNTDAEIIVGIRAVADVEISSMAELLEMTEYVETQGDFAEFIQFASFESGKSGFVDAQDWTSGASIEGASAHLTRQKDALQVYFSTNIYAP